MQTLITIDVDIVNSVFIKGTEREINMVYFIGTASGEFFNGVVEGNGADLQRCEKDGEYYLSARYILAGKDYEGNECRIFIENNGNEKIGFTPVVTTDSKALSFLEKKKLYAELKPKENGVIVIINEQKGVIK